MPTSTLHRLVVTGPPPQIDAFLADRSLWSAEPWASMFSAELKEGGAGLGRAVYEWSADYKRPGPVVAAFAAAFTDLKFEYELTDEFGQLAWHVEYADGEQVAEREVDPSSLAWVGWDEEEE